MPARGKAVCVGVNYVGTDAELRGPVNDALNFAELLVQHFGFTRDQVLVLIDEYPSGEAVGENDASGYWRPTHERLLEALAWLVRDAAPGDVLLFLFSGHGIQLPGGPCAGAAAPLEEALCPVDWDGFDWGVEPQRVLGLDALQRHFAQLPGGVLLTVVLDASLVGSPLHLPLRVDGEFPAREAEGRGATQADCPAPRPGRPPWSRAHTNTLPRRLPFHLERPLWSGLAEWCLRDAPPPLDEGVAAFCFAACRGPQTALEASLEGSAQGCLCYSLLRALEALGCRCTYLELCAAMGQVAQRLRAEVLPGMDQFFQLSYGKNAAPDECTVLDVGSAFVAKDRAHRRRGQWHRASIR